MGCEGSRRAGPDLAKREPGFTRMEVGDAGARCPGDGPWETGRPKEADWPRTEARGGAEEGEAERARKARREGPNGAGRQGPASPQAVRLSHTNAFRQAQTTPTTRYRRTTAGLARSGLRVATR